MPAKKQFVKYSFDDPPPKQREPTQKGKPPNNAKAKRYVPSTQKSNQKVNVVKDMIESYVAMKKPSKAVMEVCNSFPKYFNAIPKKPEPTSEQSLNSALVVLVPKKFELRAKEPQPLLESEQDPDWDSESDYEGGIQSKQIDAEIIEKVSAKVTNINPVLKNQLKRHEKQFLEDYYKQKKAEAETQEEPESVPKKQPLADVAEQPEKAENDWTEYEEKQVNDFIDLGYMEKVENNEDQDELDFGSEDFSVEEEKSVKSESSKDSSSEGEDDIFGDQGPCTIVKKQETKESEDEAAGKDTNNSQVKAGLANAHSGTVVINSQLFSRIAQQVGIPPQACVWIISNKKDRYRVSTQYMDQIYRENDLSNLLPYISLNHSEFVHNNDVEKPSALHTFRNYNSRRQNYERKHVAYRPKDVQPQQKAYQGQGKGYQSNPNKNKKAHLNRN